MVNIVAKSFFLLAMLVAGNMYAQCNWTSVYYESYEYTTVIPYLIPGTTYQDTPQTYAGCVRTGSSGMYLNFVDGVSGLVYNQPFDNMCVGQEYRFSFSTRDAWTSNNDLTFNVKDASGVILATQNVLNGSTWNDITMPSFIATTTTCTFEIVTNIPGGPGNDAGFDDLRLWQCQPTPVNYTFTDCSTASGIDAYNQINNPVLSTSGNWSGPTALTNGYLGTFTPGTNTNGTYSYTVTGATGCADSVANVSINYINQPQLDPINNVQACQSYVLPAITGTNLSGNEKYYTGSGATGTAYNAGQSITATTVLYAYGGTTGCYDEESFTVTISQPVTAGADNGAYYCGTGAVIDLSTFLSASATSGGVWSETTSPASGQFNPSNQLFTTSGLPAGTYTFAYTLAPNGGCAGDQATFDIVFDNAPQVNLGPDTTLCTGQTITLNAASGGSYDNYKWNNNSTSATRVVTSAGTYSVRAGKLGGNQIVNGDFESGNTGFTTDYGPGTGGTWGPLSNPGTYAITNNPNAVHTNFFSCSDHTPAPGTQMMVVNGAGTPNTNVWCQNVPVQANTDYQFGAWVSNATNDPNVAQLQFYINGSPLGTQFSTSTIGCTWQQFFQVWSSGGNSSAQICIVNQNTNGGGNDFMLDDITFKPICYSYDTIVVSYSTYPVVDLGNDTTLCIGDSLVLDAQNAGDSYLWSDGSTNQTLTVSTSGTVTVTVTNPDQCARTDQINIAIENLKNAGNDSLATWCVTAGNVDLNSLLSSNADMGGVWSDPSGTLGGLTGNGTFSTNNNVGGYQVQYVVSGTYCPNDTSDFALTINDQSQSSPTVNLDLCNTVGDQVDLSPYVSSSYEVNTPYWVETSANTSNQFDPTTGTLDLSNLLGGIYEFSYVLPVDSMCVQDTSKVTVTVTENPIISFSSDVVKGCFPLEVNLVNESNAPTGSDVFWDLGDGTTVTQQDLINHVYNSVNCFDVTLTITVNNLCTQSKTIPDMICVDPLPIADFVFAPQQVFSIDPTVQFTNKSQLNDFNYWDFDDGDQSQQVDPVHQFPIGAVGNYEVQLIVETTEGCRDTTSRVIEVKDQMLIYVPNTFTPDGDEYNNVFQPVLTAGFDPYSYELLIFNRWGELIFESNDVYSGWDGTYHGEMCQEGIYIWNIRFKDDSSDKRYEFNGHINLLR